MVCSKRPVERRKWPRAEFSAMAHVRPRNGPSDVFGINNLSAGGALLVGAADYSVGEQLEISLELPVYGYVSVSAYIVRVQNNEQGNSLIAVNFIEVDPAAEDAIHNTVLFHLEKTTASVG